MSTGGGAASAPDGKGVSAPVCPRRHRAMPRDPWALAATALLAAIVVVVFWRALARGEVLFRRDVHLMWYSQVEAMVRAVSRGEWPLWNAAIGFGQPLWADANAQVLYPFTWLNLVMRPWTYYTLFVAVHLMLAGLGARALGRVLGLGAAGSAAAGILWVASGPVLSMAEVWNQLAGAAWIPWTLAAAVRALQTSDRRWAVAWGAGAAAQILAGSPEAFLLSGTGAAAYAFAVRSRRSGGGAPAPRRLRASAIALAVALGLSAGQWMPAVAAAADSNRARLSADARGHWSVHPLGLAQLFFPIAADQLTLRPEAASVLFGGRAPLLPSLYLGLGSVALAAAAFAGRRRRGAPWLAAAFAATLALALGRHLPVHALITGAVPPLRALRYPVKAMMAASLCWALLCGLGVDTWCAARAATLRRWGSVVLVPAAVVAVTAAAAALAVGLWPDAIGAALLTGGSPVPFAARLIPARGELAAAAAAGALIAIFCALRMRSAARTAPLAAAALVTAILDLLAVHADLVPTAPVTLFTHRPPALEAAQPPDHGRLYTYDYFVPGRGLRHLSRPDPFRIDRAPEGWSTPAAMALSMRLALFPPSAASWGVAGSFDHDTPEMAPRRSATLFDALLEVEGTSAHERLLALAGVSRVVTLHERGFEHLPGLATADALLPEAVLVRAVPAARPRAYAVSEARVIADDGEALAQVLDPRFAPERVVLLASGAPSAATPGFRGSVRVARIGADRVLLEAELSGPGFVVVNDAWAPGWTARVDGRPTVVRRANVAWRAVEVGAGRHLVELRYWPVGLSLGLASSAVTLLAAAVMVTRGRRAQASGAAA